MAPREPGYFENTNFYDCQMNAEDFTELENDVFSEDVVFSEPEEEFIATIDEWWSDFLSDIIS